MSDIDLAPLGEQLAPILSAILYIILIAFIIAFIFFFISMKVLKKYTNITNPFIKIAISLLICFGVFFGTYRILTHIPYSSSNANGAIVEFTGVLTAFDDGCTLDSACIAHIDGVKQVMTNPGDIEYIKPVGKSDVWNKDVGKVVKVRAIKTGINVYTLLGDDSLYVKTVED